MKRQYTRTQLLSRRRMALQLMAFGGVGAMVSLGLLLGAILTGGVQDIAWGRTQNAMLALALACQIVGALWEIQLRKTPPSELDTQDPDDQP